MSTFNPPQQTPQPHRSGFFTNLLQQFRRTEHPATADLEELDDGLEQVDGTNALDLLKLDADRSKRIAVYDEMDSHGLVASVLDLYAEETTQADYDKQKRVWIESNSKEMVKQGDVCLTNLMLEDKITAIARRVAKNGDDFHRLIYDTGRGVLGWKNVKPAQVRRIEDAYGRLVGFAQEGKKFRQQTRGESWPWDYTHFRMLGKDDDDLYGTSMLEAMFRPWRQLALTEDALLQFRLRKTPDRNAVYVKVGTNDPTEAAHWLNHYRKKFRKSEFVDPASSNYRKQYNPMTPLEDVFLAVRDGDEVRIEPLTGAGNAGEVYDLEYFRDAFFGSARVPKAYVGFEGEINAKATLLMQDVRFARGCKRLRTSLIRGIRNTLDIHYVLSGAVFDPTLPKNQYVVQMSPISYLDEFERLELVQLRFQILEAQMRVATDLQLDTRVWASYILLNYAKLPEDLVLRLVTKTSAPANTSPEDANASFERILTPAQKQIWATLDPSLRAQVLDTSPGPRTHFALTEDEVRACAQMVHTTPGLRRVISDICLFQQDHSLEETAARQVDLSLVPPSGRVASDLQNDTHAKQLAEDLEKLREGKPLTEVTT